MIRGFLAVVCCATIAVPGAAHTLAAEFVHPGILHTAADLQRMRDKVAAGAQPYLDGFKILQRHPQSSSNYAVRGGFEEVSRKPSVVLIRIDARPMMRQPELTCVDGPCRA